MEYLLEQSELKGIGHNSFLEKTSECNSASEWGQWCSDASREGQTPWQKKHSGGFYQKSYYQVNVQDPL